ncbi:MAG: isocitrate/isopropylmalate dehydrogenase family protein [Zestosphaera sp.]|uniref:isocitrate/isopropylmalate dehydrogenase family protein n=1 Tax=Saccharolobus sp. TaxID=2100761 RepID=UPI00316F4FB2
MACTSKKKFKIAVIPGDGIGPEVIREGVKVVNTACEVININIEWDYFPFGADYYLSTGRLIEEDDLRTLSKYDAIYFGAIGDPRVEPGILEKGIVLTLRFYFDQYINLRPVKLLPGVESPLKGKKSGDINFVIIRENTEDFYVGLGSRVRRGKNERVHQLMRSIYKVKFDIDIETDSEELAYQIGIISKEGAERVVSYSFNYALMSGFEKITFVDKANVLDHMYGLWRAAVNNVAKKFAKAISYEFEFADAISMHLIRAPERYQVITTPNLFGDILSDLGAALMGGLGLAPGANINPNGISMFEPIHGSAPKYKGKQVANPIATIWAGALMLKELGVENGHDLILNAISRVLKEGRVRTYDLGGTSKTYEVGDEIVKKIKEEL